MKHPDTGIRSMNEPDIRSVACRQCGAIKIYWPYDGPSYKCQAKLPRRGSSPESSQADILPLEPSPTVADYGRELASIEKRLSELLEDAFTDRISYGQATASCVLWLAKWTLHRRPNVSQQDSELTWPSLNPSLVSTVGLRLVIARLAFCSRCGNEIERPSDRLYQQVATMMAAYVPSAVREEVQRQGTRCPPFRWEQLPDAQKWKVTWGVFGRLILLQSDCGWRSS